MNDVSIMPTSITFMPVERMPSIRALASSGELRPHVAADDHRVFAAHLLIAGDVLPAAFEELARGVADLPGGFFVERDWDRWRGRRRL